MNHSFRLKRLIITTNRQGSGCPVIDGATLRGTTINARGVEPFTAPGICICLSPRADRALTVGLIGGPSLPWRAARPCWPRALFAPRRHRA